MQCSEMPSGAELYWPPKNSWRNVFEDPEGGQWDSPSSDLSHTWIPHHPVLLWDISLSSPWALVLSSSTWVRLAGNYFIRTSLELVSSSVHLFLQLVFFLNQRLQSFILELTSSKLIDTVMEPKALYWLSNSLEACCFAKQSENTSRVKCMTVLNTSVAHSFVLPRSGDAYRDVRKERT